MRRVREIPPKMEMGIEFSGLVNSFGVPRSQSRKAKALATPHWLGTYFRPTAVDADTSRHYRVQDAQSLINSAMRKASKAKQGAKGRGGRSAAASEAEAEAAEAEAASAERLAAWKAPWRDMSAEERAMEMLARSAGKLDPAALAAVQSDDSHSSAEGANHQRDAILEIVNMPPSLHASTNSAVSDLRDVPLSTDELPGDEKLWPTAVGDASRQKMIDAAEKKGESLASVDEKLQLRERVVQRALAAMARDRHEELSHKHINHLKAETNRVAQAMIGSIMKDGKKKLAERHLRNALTVAKEFLQKEAAETGVSFRGFENSQVVLAAAMHNVRPRVLIRYVKSAGQSSGVPYACRQERSEFQAAKWLVDSANEIKARGRTPRERDFGYALGSEIAAAALDQGGAVAKKHAMHKLCADNRGNIMRAWW